MLMNAACARMTMVLMAAPLFSALFAKMGGAARKVRGKRRANASSTRDRRKTVQNGQGPAKTCACHEKGWPRERPPLAGHDTRETPQCARSAVTTVEPRPSIVLETNLGLPST